MGIRDWLRVGRRRDCAECAGPLGCSVEVLEPRLLLSAETFPVAVASPPLDLTLDDVTSINLPIASPGDVSPHTEGAEPCMGQMHVLFPVAASQDEPAEGQVEASLLSAVGTPIECLLVPESSPSPIRPADADVDSDMPVETDGQFSMADRLVETLHVANGPPGQDLSGGSILPSVFT